MKHFWALQFLAVTTNVLEMWNCESQNNLAMTKLWAWKTFWLGWRWRWHRKEGLPDRADWEMAEGLARNKVITEHNDVAFNHNDDEIKPICSLSYSIWRVLYEKGNSSMISGCVYARYWRHFKDQQSVQKIKCEQFVKISKLTAPFVPSVWSSYSQQVSKIEFIG